MVLSGYSHLVPGPYRTARKTRFARLRPGCRNGLLKSLAQSRKEAKSQRDRKCLWCSNPCVSVISVVPSPTYDRADRSAFPSSPKSQFAQITVPPRKQEH